MGEKNKKPTFTEAVQAIVESHTSLYDLLMEVLPAYRGEAEMPPREKRVSRILDCETNDAHRLTIDGKLLFCLLQRFNAAIKFGKQFFDSCNDALLL